MGWRACLLRSGWQRCLSFPRFFCSLFPPWHRAGDAQKPAPSATNAWLVPFVPAPPPWGPVGTCSSPAGCFVLVSAQAGRG